MGMFDLKGKRILITGGGTGLGKRFADVLATAGAHVALAARRVDKLTEVVAALRARGLSAECMAMDVCDASSVQRAIDAITQGGRIDVLVNNAGMASDKMLLDMQAADWDQVFDTNLKGAWQVANACARAMIADSNGGSIINIASTLSFAHQKGTAPYGASKAGLVHLTKSMAIEWARYRIRVNAIAPGYIITDISADYLATDIAKAMIKRLPLRRLGESQELDGALLLLASEASSYMTGSVITVDGGLSLPII
jgi:NAD(P)-dependent dehydrogenase (short-subunit alcohol dehydrogenase family)